MSISYKKLWIKIAENEMATPKVREKSKVSASTFTKIKKNEYKFSYIRSGVFVDDLNMPNRHGWRII